MNRIFNMMVKKHWKTVLLFVLCFMVILLLRELHKVERDENKINQRLSEKEYKDGNGNNHVEKSDKYVLRDDIKGIIEQLNIKNIREKQIERYIETRSVYIDTVYFKKNIDTVYDENSVFIINKIDSLNTRINYRIYDTVKVACLWRRKWFLGRKKYFIDVQNTNIKSSIYVDKNIVPVRQRR